MARIPTPNENLEGKVCVCSTGRTAIVTGKKTFDFGEAYVGLGLDGKGTWASTAPVVIAENGTEFHDKLLSRFGGKMSHNG
jgi:hydroxymethylpyrimidine pyrophosphatase-like HAD family hydrolase